MRVYQFWVKFWPAPDLPGEWIAHCLDFDVVTQGQNLPHVMAMTYEAISMTICDDLSNNLDPTERRAPPEFWTELYEATRGKRTQSLNELASDPEFRGTVYANLEIQVHEAVAQQEPTGIAMVA